MADVYEVLVRREDGHETVVRVDATSGAGAKGEVQPDRGSEVVATAKAGSRDWGAERQATQATE